MKLTRRQHAILDLVQASQDLEEAERQVQEIADVSARMRMVEAHDRFLDAMSKAQRYVNSPGELAEHVAAGLIFFKLFNDKES